LNELLEMKKLLDISGKAVQQRPAPLALKPGEPSVLSSELSKAIQDGVSKAGFSPERFPDIYTLSLDELDQLVDTVIGEIYKAGGDPLIKEFLDFDYRIPEQNAPTGSAAITKEQVQPPMNTQEIEKAYDLEPGEWEKIKKQFQLESANPGK
jgi:hypothetical protein